MNKPRQVAGLVSLFSWWVLSTIKGVHYIGGVYPYRYFSISPQVDVLMSDLDGDTGWFAIGVAIFDLLGDDTGLSEGGQGMLFAFVRAGQGATLLVCYRTTETIDLHNRAPDIGVAFNLFNDASDLQLAGLNNHDSHSVV
jgi:hypothetical protein